MPPSDPLQGEASAIARANASDIQLLSFSTQPLFMSVVPLLHNLSLPALVTELTGGSLLLVMPFGTHPIVNMSDFTLDLSTDSLEIHQHSVEPWNVTLIDTGQDTQTGGRLRRVRDQLGDDTFCFTYGDIV